MVVGEGRRFVVDVECSYCRTVLKMRRWYMYTFFGSENTRDGVLYSLTSMWYHSILQHVVHIYSIAKIQMMSNSCIN